MRKWEALAQRTFNDIERLKAEENARETVKKKKRADNDCTAVIVDNICRIRKRIGRG